MIAPYVEVDPTAFCSYEDHLLAVDTLLEVCRLRSESIRGQLEGDYPITLAQTGGGGGRLPCGSAGAGGFRRPGGCEGAAE